MLKIEDKNYINKKSTVGCKMQLQIDTMKRLEDDLFPWTR